MTCERSWTSSPNSTTAASPKKSVSRWRTGSNAASPIRKVLKRAETVRADIEREAQTKRNAIEAIFAKEPAKKATPPSRDAAKDKAPGS